MMEHRKLRWPLWITVVLSGVPLLYVASFGPACWLVRRGVLSIGVAAEVYRPLIRAVAAAPDGIQEAFADFSGKAPRAPFGIAVSGPTLLHRISDHLNGGGDSGLR